MFSLTSRSVSSLIPLNFLSFLYPMGVYSVTFSHSFAYPPSWGFTEHSFFLLSSYFTSFATLLYKSRCNSYVFYEALHLCYLAGNLLVLLLNTYQISL